MQKIQHNEYLLSPTDLVKFFGCHHATYLDMHEIASKNAPSAMNEQLSKNGNAHETAYLNILKSQGLSVIEIPKEGILEEERSRLTIEALHSGADVIYQGFLKAHPWRGDADFLIKIQEPSALGDFSYEVLDTKLSKHPKSEYILQLSVYSELLANIQKKEPVLMYIVTGDGKRHDFKVKDFASYYQKSKNSFESFVNNPLQQSTAEPCNYCALCHWKDHCTAQWEASNHLSLVANIQRSQIKRLRTAGITNIKDLAALPIAHEIPDFNKDVLLRLREQALLQEYKRETGKDRFELIPLTPGKGFERIPKRNVGDIFFDMEGDPLHPDGLEYLFGIYYFENKQSVFIPFWGHTHEEEKEAFRKVMTFLNGHLTQYPKAYIYHYNHYEVTALKRLACRYGLFEEMLDNLLRTKKFVDLYKAVRESIRTSEPGYSIKNLETFYMDKREGTVSTAVDSIVFYNKWRESGESCLLKDIETYNELDCASTYKLRDWLLKIKPKGAPFFLSEALVLNNDGVSRKDWEIEYEASKKLLEDKYKIDPKEMYRQLADLIEFHNREKKPQWWAYFERHDKFEDELINDPECLAGLTLAGSQSSAEAHFYCFPPQEYKLKAGRYAKDIRTGKSWFIIQVDDVKNIVKIKPGNTPPPNRLSLGPSDPISTDGIRSAIYRVSDSILEADKKYAAIKDILNKTEPNIKGRQRGQPVSLLKDPLSGAMEAVLNLKKSYLIIQGPPGSGKTYTSSHIIVELMRQGKKVGVAANSHKAIHNLLDQIEKVADSKNFQFFGVKKSSGQESDYQGKYIKNEPKTKKIDLRMSLFAGTAWLFSDSIFDQELDYLFIDEAGQVSVANVVAMGAAAKNIVLVGDQMQLGQPIQGVHPGEAGLSILEFLLGDYQTVPPSRGIFLQDTYRLEPGICKFISEAFYEGRLNPHPSTSNRNLLLDYSDLPSKGVHVIHAKHTGCAQKSVEEGVIIKGVYEKLLGQSFNDGKNIRAVIIDDILVVTPYNVQANHLSAILPEGARVGTVDKFQGQEAPIVLVSMVTSSAEDLPRNIEFLYSQNRLNVAVSRAQCLAVIVFNPALLEVPCKTIEQMRLVNTFCFMG